MLSQTARYGLRAALFIAERNPGSPLPVKEMAEALDVPRNYLSKILHRMAQVGLLTSTRGRGGGFLLSRAPGLVTLGEVIACLEPADAHESRCLLGRPECSDEDPCTAHQRWCALRSQRDAFFANTTLEDLVRTSG